MSLTTPTDRPDLLINSHKLFPRMIKEKHSKISSRYPKVTPHQKHHDTYYSWWEGVNTQILNTRLISQILEYMQSYHKLFCNNLLTRMLWTNLHASTFAPSSTTAWPSDQPSGNHPCRLLDQNMWLSSKLLDQNMHHFEGGSSVAIPLSELIILFFLGFYSSSWYSSSHLQTLLASGIVGYYPQGKSNKLTIQQSHTRTYIKPSMIYQQKTLGGWCNASMPQNVPNLIIGCERLYLYITTQYLLVINQIHTQSERDTKEMRCRNK